MKITPPSTFLGQNDVTPPNSGGGGVTQIVAGTNITISPVGGTGVVTINSSGGGSSNGYYLARRFGR